MPALPIATFNAEWMLSIFGGQQTNWDGTIPDTFPGKNLGSIKLEPIEDVPALCTRIANVIIGTGAKIIGIEEGPPLREQMELFVSRFLGGDFAVFTSNKNQQAVHALVHRSIAAKTTAFAPDGPEVAPLRAKIPFYPWGEVATPKKHSFDRVPLVLTFRPAAGKSLRIIVVHTKSKFSKLKSRQQWEDRDEEAILDALLARQKLSAEVFRLREFIAGDLAGSNAPDALVAMGDFNDGAAAELMEREFMIHNIIDELTGSLSEPDRYLKHVMPPEILQSAFTVEFPDPLSGGAMTRELIDHIVVSPSIWTGNGPYGLTDSRVETAAFDANDGTDPAARKRGDRPSDHRPVCATLEY